MHICDITSILCSRTVGCIIVLRPFDLGHFEHGQLAYHHCSWASLLGSLPVLNAHSFASNWQLPFLNQRKGENGRRIFFHDQISTKECAGREDRTRNRLLARTYAHQRHSKAWNKWGLPPQKHLQISIQVNWDFNRIAKWFEIASHAFLVFKISPGVAPGPPYKNRYTGKFWISLLYPTSVPRRHPHPNHQTDAKHVVICWASAYDNLWFCDPTGFICSLRVELPLPPHFSPIFILLLGYGYCFVKVLVSFQVFFFFFFAGSGKFYWLSKFSTE